MNYHITLTDGPQFTKASGQSTNLDFVVISQFKHKFKHLSLILFSLPCAYPIVTNFKRANGRHVVQHRKNLIIR
ncbi:hypothetical protein EUGRSUZ_C02120 [Eucalyptus grandis]|uniref:Uncharacterized protein n=2 Tax=Eucalyptus grandis TaxID=71139 RepID=A0ACC3LGG4_EUCGR|nr:hypothetical protein EUGRSUZ_C02120 [Eucalyptus grandis]